MDIENRLMPSCSSVEAIEEIIPVEDKSKGPLTPAAEGHGLWPWMNASRQWTGDVAPLGREVGATGFARGAPLLGKTILDCRGSL